MTPNHTVVRNDLIKIFALAVLLLLVMAVLYWYDQRTEVFGEWSQKFYQFILRR